MEKNLRTLHVERSTSHSKLLQEALDVYRREEQSAWGEEAAEYERKTWGHLLGTTIDVDRPPDVLTAQKKQTMEKELDVKFLYIPALDIGTLSELKIKGEELYLKDQNKKYPLLRPLEKTGKYGHMRNMPLLYWENVKREEIDFPRLSGQWVAVENLPTPRAKESYCPTPISEMLEIPSRRNLSANEVQEKIKDKKDAILYQYGLKEKGDIRLLRAEEYNLVGNRMFWGHIGRYELVSTKLRVDEKDRHLIMGKKAAIGFEDTFALPSNESDTKVGCRPVIVFNS